MNDKDKVEVRDKNNVAKKGLEKSATLVEEGCARGRFNFSGEGEASVIVLTYSEYAVRK